MASWRVCEIGGRAHDAQHRMRVCEEAAASHANCREHPARVPAARGINPQVAGRAHHELGEPRVPPRAWVCQSWSRAPQRAHRGRRVQLQRERRRAGVGMPGHVCVVRCAVCGVQGVVRPPRARPVRVLWCGAAPRVALRPRVCDESEYCCAWQSRRRWCWSRLKFWLS